MALRERPMQVLAATDRDTLIDVAKTKRKPKYRHSTSSLPATPLKGFADFRQWRSEPNVLQNETRVIDLGSLTAKPLLNPARKTQQRGPSRASTPSAWNGSQNNVTVSKNLGSAGVMMPPPTLPSHVAVDKTFRNRITPSRTSLPPLATEPVSAPKSVVSVTETIPDALFDNPELGVDFDQQIVNEVTTVLQQDKCDGFLEPPAAFMAVELQDDFEEPEKFIGTPAPTCIFPVKVDPLLVGEGSKEALSKVLKPLVVRNVEFPGAKPARGAVPVKKVESTPLHTTDLQKTSQQRLAAEEKHTHDLYDAFQAKKRYKEAKQLIQVMWESRQRRDVSFLIPTQHPVALLDINMALNPPRKFIARPVISSAGGARSRLEAHSGSNAIGLSSLDPLPGIGADALRRQIWCPSKEDLSGTRSITSREGGEKGATRRLFSASRIWKNVSDRMQRHVIESATSIENTRKESDNKPTVDDWTDVHAGLVQSQGKGVEHSPQPISKPTSVHSITSLAILPHRRRRRLIHSEKRHPLLVRTFSAMRAISAPKSSKPKVTAYVNTQSGVRYVSLKRNRRPQPPIPKHVGKGLPEIMAEMNEVLNNLMFVHPEQGKMMVQREKVEGEEEEEKKGLKLRWRRRTRVPRCKDSEIEPVPKEDSDGVDEVQQDVGNSEFVEKAEKGPKVEKSGIAKKKMVQQARTDYDFYHLHKEDIFESLHMPEIELALPLPKPIHLLKHAGNVVTYTTDGWADLHEISTPERSKLLYVSSDKVTIRPTTTPQISHHVYESQRCSSASPREFNADSGLGLAGAHLRIHEQSEVMPPPPTRRREVTEVLAAVDSKARKHRVPYVPNPKHAVLRSRGVMSSDGRLKTNRRRSPAVVVDYLSMRREKAIGKEGGKVEVKVKAQVKVEESRGGGGKAISASKGGRMGRGGGGGKAGKKGSIGPGGDGEDDDQMGTVPEFGGGSGGGRMGGDRRRRSMGQAKGGLTAEEEEAERLRVLAEQKVKFI